jgi:hypothetical protein
VKSTAELASTLLLALRTQPRISYSAGGWAVTARIEDARCVRLSVYDRFDTTFAGEGFVTLTSVSSTEPSEAVWMEGRRPHSLGVFEKHADAATALLDKLLELRKDR